MNNADFRNLFKGAERSPTDGTPQPRNLSLGAKYRPAKLIPPRSVKTSNGLAEVASRPQAKKKSVGSKDCAKNSEDRRQALRKDILDENVNGESDHGHLPEDQEFEALEAQNIIPIERESVPKHGSLAPKPVAGVKRSRNDILAEYRASRKAKEERQALSKLESGFSRIDQPIKQETARVEIDERGREVLITIDEQGRVKRKVRKLKPAVLASKTGESGLGHTGDTKPSISAIDRIAEQQPIFTAAHAAEKLRADENKSGDDDDDDIFADAGDDYDPLGEGATEIGNGYDAENDSKSARMASSPHHSTAKDSSSASKVKRNYFESSLGPPEESPVASAPFKDPTILAAIKRAAQINSAAGVGAGEEGSNIESKPTSAAERLLNRRDRDLEDMDLEFGASRAGDEEDASEDLSRIRFSDWKGLDAGEDAGDQQTRSGAKQRKRGQKKRKGDKNSATDVLRVMNSRK